MERYCGFLKRSGVRNRNNPYKSLDQRVLNVSRLHVVKLKYGLVGVLPPRQPHQDVGEVFPERKFVINQTNTQLTPDTDPTYMLMTPKKYLKLSNDLRLKVVDLLITRYSPLNRPMISVGVAKNFVSDTEEFPHWGQLQIMNGGDKVGCQAIGKHRSDARDNTYIRVSSPSSIHDANSI